MCFNISFTQQLNAFRKDGTILAPDGNINEEGYWNFKDWICETSSLEPKAKLMMQCAARFAADHPELNSDRYYVMFKSSSNDTDSFNYEIQIADEKGKLSDLSVNI